MSRTIAKAIQKLDGEVEVENFFAWLKTMMLNLRTDEMRRAVVRGTQPVESEQLESYAGADWSTDEQILKDSDSEAIRQAIAELDPKYRQAMLMRYYDDFSFKEIAQILNLPMGTVSRRIQIAHHLLASKLGAKLGRKPIALLAAALLGIGTLFGVWQVGLGEWVEELISSPQSEATQIEAVQSEATQPEGTRHSCRVSQDESTASTTTDLTTTKEEPPMNTIKGTLLAAATAVSLMSTAQADEPTPVTPETIVSLNAGTVGRVGDDIVLSFTNTANTYTFTIPNDVKSIRYLVVAGGGAGGNYNDGAAGGGGAGGMLTGEGITVETGNVLTIKVGAGGDGTTNKDGDASSLALDSLALGSTVIACADGGGGGGVNGAAPHSGGSGGGGNGAGSNARKIYAGADAKPASDGRKQGNAGGGVAYDSKTNIGGGGGGGANGETNVGKGGDGSQASGGKGGDGSPCDITGEDDKYYAGGGGGAARNKSNPGGTGGKGGGGAGAGTSPAGNGEDGTGSGGGGGASGNTKGGKGGDGIVIIRYTPPVAAKATVHFSYDPNTVTWVATDIGGEVKEGGEVDDGATITVVATPKDGYEYALAPEGWKKNADDTITADFVAEAPECTISIPAATAIPFTMNFTSGANASYTATVDGQPVQNGAKIRTGKQIVVVATPNTDCEYAAIPEGWVAGEVEGTLTRTITAGEGVPQLTIPDAAAIDYVQVQFTSNGSAFFEATNAVGEEVAGRVRAGTEVFVKIWAGVGFVYNETPTGWTWEAEGGPYTKAFTALSGSTLTIQIPNAREIGGKWTKTIDEHDGYMFETNKDLVVVFTNVTKTHTMILPSGMTSLRYLVVGGGGAGGYGSDCCGGGGGAGGMLTNNEFKVIGRTLKINVGKGGNGNKDGVGNNGEDSMLVNGAAVIRAFGGGGGGGGTSSSNINPPNEGGSGGGGNGSTSNARKIFAGAAAKVAEDGRTQGHAGGGVAYDSQTSISASGGGGAGGKGGDGSYGGKGGDGGVGLLCDITGEDNKYYAAGGGGACYDGYKDAGVGGSGIGGNGGKSASVAAGPGVDGTGSGGGGARNNGASGKGGDGVVILRFKKPSSGIVIFIM